MSLLRPITSILHQTQVPAASIRRLAFTSALRSKSLDFHYTPARHAGTSSKMVAPAGLLSNRYKVEDIPDLTGKVAIVTGGSRGIGEALVSALVRKGCDVHILSATEEHGEEAISKISQESSATDGDRVHHHTVDLGSISSLKSLIPTLTSLPCIDLLFLIAGVGVAPFGLTQDGLGNHFAVNHLAHMALVDGLLPKMIETSKSKSEGNGDGHEKWTTRIVVESSELHRASPGDMKCDNVDEFNHEMDPTILYGRSKLLNILFIRQLAKHLPSLTSPNPILALSVHPGAVSTEQQKGATQAYGLIGKVLEGAASLGFMSADQGAESALWAGTSPAVGERREEVQGRYFSEADGKVDTETDQGKDDQLAQKLWDLSVGTLAEKGYEVKM